VDNNRYILITGASSGLGQNAAIKLSENYNLILNGRNPEKLDKTFKLCNADRKHLIWNYDLNEVENLENNLNNFIADNNIEISVFIHFAGILKLLPITGFSLKNIQDSVNTNFISATLIIKSLLNRKVYKNNLSNIVLISSIASLRGAKAFSIYSASKGALDSMMRSLAVELAPQVRVNSILPGGVRTEMTEKIYRDSELIKRMEKDYPLGYGEPDDIYEMINFLISDKARWITGQQFVIDGGRIVNITG
jgi:NAD(P)-dependent dehydrogenase (short-subunit alcohol dehydrogenase family)